MQLPTQAFFTETFGLPLTMNPNFEVKCTFCDLALTSGTMQLLACLYAASSVPLWPCPKDFAHLPLHVSDNHPVNRCCSGPQL